MSGPAGLVLYSLLSLLLFPDEREPKKPLLPNKEPAGRPGRTTIPLIQGKSAVIRIEPGFAGDAPGVVSIPTGTDQIRIELLVTSQSAGGPLLNRLGRARAGGGSGTELAGSGSGSGETSCSFRIEQGARSVPQRRFPMVTGNLIAIDFPVADLKGKGVVRLVGCESLGKVAEAFTDGLLFEVQ